MAIAAMILGIIFLVSWLTIRVLHLSFGIPSPLPIGPPYLPIWPFYASVSVVGFILGIIALAKSKPHKRMAVAGVVMCSLGIIWLAILLVIVIEHWL